MRFTQRLIQCYLIFANFCICACGDLLKDEEDEETVTVTCIKSADGSSRNVIAESTESGFEINLKIFSDDQCKNKIITIEEINGFSSQKTGAYTATLQDTLSLTIHDATVAAGYSALSVCGNSAWVVDTPVSVKVADCTAALNLFLKF